MQENLPGNRPGRWLAGLGLVLLTTLSAQAQLTGTKTIPGSYATLAAAITDLNTQGVGTGGVTFNIAAGYTETAANLLITATGTAANPIVFQKSGSGANPLITAGVGTSTTLDAVIELSGADYVTIDGIDVAESATNATATTQMEFGYALFRASVTNGSQFNIIRNCVVTLNKTNTNTIGIYGAPSTAASATAITATSAAGANSSNKVYGNVVTNALSGIYFAAGTSTSIANYDQNNEIGVTAGNTIGNFGGTASGWGAGGTYQNGLKITGNTLNSTLNYTSATASTAVAASTVTSTLRGIYTPSGTSSSLDITNNTITLASGATSSQVSGIENGMGSTPASNTVNITGNTLTNFTYATSTSASIYLLYNTGSPATLNITGNTVTANNLGGTASTSTASYLIYSTGSGTAATVSGNTVTNNTMAGTGSIYLLYGGSPTTLTMNGNRMTGNTRTGGVTTSGTMYCLGAGTTAATVTGNTVDNNSVVTAGTSSATLYGYYDASSPTAETVVGNTFTNLSISGATTSTGSTLYGMYSNPIAATVKSYSQNVIGTLSVATGGTVAGIYTITGNTVDITRNKIYDLSVGTSSGVAHGIYLSSGTTVTVANNLIGDLRAFASTSTGAVNGIYVSGPTTANLYYNTISLAAASTGATFGTSGIYFSTTPTTVDLRNNLVVNKSTAVGAGGYTAALRRASGTAGTVPANLATTANNNLYYAGTPSATNLIYVEGTTTATNAQQTLAAYKTFAGNRDQASVTEDVAFLSTTGTAATFLHINPTTPTQIESAGTPIATITTDFDGDARSATTPDLGADEGTFQGQDMTAPTIGYTALGNTSNLTTRTLTATITDASGLGTGANAPRLFFRKGTTGTYVSVLATTVSGSSYTFTFDYSLVGGIAPGDVVQYYVAAQDAAATPNAGTSPTGGTYNTAPATPNSFTVLGTLSGIYYVGSGTSPNAARTYQTLTAAATAYNTNGLSGAVSFLLLDASYGATTETFPIVFNANADASATNTLTIRPNTGVTSTITSSTSAAATIQLSGASYITLDGANVAGTTTRNLTISNPNTTGGAAVQLISLGTGAGATNDVVRNLNLATASTTAGIAVSVGGATAGASGADNDNVTIQNNNITPAFVGIYAGGSAAVSAGGLDGLVVTGNTIGGATSGTGNIGSAGVFVANAVAPSVTLNTVQNMSGTTLYGLNFPTGATNATVSQNTVLNVTSTSNNYGINLGAGFTGNITRNQVLNLTATGSSGYGSKGIDVQTGSATGALVIANNFVSLNVSSGWTNLSSDANVGIRLGTGSALGSVSLYYNSVNMTGTENYSGATQSAALYVGSATTALDIRNNILRNGITNSASSSAKAYALYSAAANTAFTAIDNNDYYVSGSQGVLGYLGSDRATLADLRTATGKDASSISVDPLFLSATNLHATSVALDATATPIAGITTDIDGDVRNTSTPDIGADEFTVQANDLAAVALVAPATTSTCYGTAEAVSVSIRNAGSAALNFATSAATITVVVTLPGGTTQTLTTTLNTGTLASNATQTVTLPTTLNMSTVGTYSFAITATVAGDGNTANDLLAPAPTRTVVAPVAGTLAPANTSICVSGTAALTLTGAANGSIQFQSSPDNVTFTDIAGATSATYTTPVLTTTTYYRAQVRCNTGTATSNVSTITVNNPLVASTNTPVSVCTGTSATLTATASAGSSVRFFSTATGGTALATTTAGTYTTPALTAATTYYAEAYSGSVENVGAAAYNSTGQTPQTGGALYFTTTGPNTIANVTVYLNAGQAAGTVTIDLRTGSSTTGAIVNNQSVAFAVPAGPATGVAPYIIPLNYQIPAAGAYTLHLSAASQGGLLRDDSGANTTSYPYAAPSGAVRITGASVSGYYYYFYNWQLGSECVGATRTAIQVNVTQPATATFSYPATGGNCAGSTGTVAATLATGATAGTFTSTTGLTLNATTGAVNLATSTAGTYTVTNTVAATGGCGAVTATATITVNPMPARPTLTAAYNGTTTTLTSSAATGNQFYFNGTAIAGATGQTYVVNGSATTYGSYTVVVTNSFGCSSAASVATVVTTTRAGIAGASLLVYPNPTPNGQVTLELSGFRSATQLAVIDALGRVVRTEALPATAGVVTHQLNLSGMASGVYMLRLTNADGVETRRLVRE
jgi:hypothetical protein